MSAVNYIQYCGYFDEHGQGFFLWLSPEPISIKFKKTNYVHFVLF